ncbi:hypothetical protein RM704_18165 [Streptomyces sp. DSM 3412]|uniref:Knr4/Smi1-like domain-containing protein n=1 Tax=Streptomyces gottesmaniae TaxID=3075518 RepID=A0ABU2YYI3_9ACTN|nr:hypothetical protein [Streptomyces sp. DSM 3412]MDT0569375.1 hypothetical protein [Streptomyces sp. DSM 3412]
MEELTDPRRDSVRSFLARWYGRGGEGARGALPAGPSVPGIPLELIDWHEAAAATGVDVVFQEYPVPLAELERSDDGMIVFWVENQGGYHWAVDPAQEGHPVHVRELGSDLWRDSGEPLEGFLLHSTVREAMLGADSKFSAVVPEPVLRDALTAFTALPFPPFANESPSARLYCGEDALARVAPPPAGYVPDGGEPSWMLTVAVAAGADVRRYRSSLESYVPAGADRRPSADVSADDLPF